MPIAFNAYDEYGFPNVGNTGRFGYTGQTWIPELGLFYYKARFYSPALGRFLQVDPIGYDGGINIYAYVGNDPTNRSDPSGMCDGEYCPINVFHPRLDDQVRGVKQDIGRHVAEGVAIGGSIALAEVGAVYAAARIGWMLSSRVLSVAERGGMEGFRRTVVGAAYKISNIIKNNGKLNDFLGAARESRGARTGYDHTTEMRNSIKGLRSSSESLAGSLRNPNLPPDVRARIEAWKKAADIAAKKMQDMLK
jgi:RHS repeat-associated protein